jgi:hypothetical protein
MKLFNVFRYRRSRQKPAYYLSKVVHVKSLTDVPANVLNDIYIVGSDNYFKWIVITCPNQCGRRVEINLMNTGWPKWKMKIKKEKVTLYPSIVVKECGAHFWLENNSINWSYFEDEKPPEVTQE